MPWNGDGEFPSLGALVADWVEAHLTVPDRDAKGDPFILTLEQLRFLDEFYRLSPVGKFAHFRGGQLMRPQKWGKDPLAAAIVCAEALGPTRFDGWDASGEPVGRVLGTSLIQCVATAEEQVDNTWRPIMAMLRDGEIGNTPGLDVGETRINLPNGGKIEPVSMSARARLGAPITFCTLTESHLLVESSGGLKMARAMKRNVTGMGGRWLEVTNAYDPSENSAAQKTAESVAKGTADGVFVDYRPPRSHVDFDDPDAMLREIIYVYGDSAKSAGGWVDETGILADCVDPANSQADGRRFFLNETTVGEKDLVDPLEWQVRANPGRMDPGTLVALGFDGSRSRDATVLVASRLSDGRIFTLAMWQRPADAVKEWQVPSEDVETALKNAFGLYDVTFLLADPWYYRDLLAKLDALYPGKIVEWDTRGERRMDAAINGFLTSFRNGTITHDGDPRLTAHVLSTALAKGKKKPSHEPGESEHYLRLTKKNAGVRIDGSVGMVLASEARAQAIAAGLDQKVTGGWFMSLP